MNRCYGCMREIKEIDKKCPLCGFAPEQYNANPRCLRLGTRLAQKYVVGRVIGEGGFGITYIGWDLNLEMPVAIKEYFPSGVASRDTTSGMTNTISIFQGKNEKIYKEGLERYMKEARNLSKFHALSGIVSIRDFFYDNETAYIVMEYVQGITLKSYLKTVGKMAPGEVLRIMKPIIVALSKMHREGVIHRDISPDNIMIREDGEVKLIDFGAARIAQGEEEKSLTVMLKKGFTPEEQYRSKGLQGPWTDVYAICATMYYMMTGHIPPESMERVVDDQIQSLKGYGLDLDESKLMAIEKGLKVRAKERFADIGGLLHILYGEEIEEAEPITIPGFGRKASEREVNEFEDNTVLMDENYEEPKVGAKSGKKLKRMVAAIAGTVIFFSIIMVVFLMNQKNRKEKVTQGAINATSAPIENGQEEAIPTETPFIEYEIPNLVGEGEENAKTIMAGVDPNVTVHVVEVYGTEEDVGKVVAQNIEAGTKYGEGGLSEITLNVSAGVEKVKVPNVVGKGSSEAKAELKALFLKVNIKKEYHSSVKKGMVISQSVRAKTDVLPGANVELVVSKGKKPDKKPIKDPISDPTRNPTPNPTKQPTKKDTEKPDLEFINPDLEVMD